VPCVCEGHEQSLVFVETAVFSVKQCLVLVETAVFSGKQCLVFVKVMNRALCL